MSDLVKRMKVILYQEPNQWDKDLKSRITKSCIQIEQGKQVDLSQFPQDVQDVIARERDRP